MVHENKENSKCHNFLLLFVPIYIHQIITSSVASSLALGGGGQAPQMYRQKKRNHVHVTYARASALRNI